MNRPSSDSLLLPLLGLVVALLLGLGAWQVLTDDGGARAAVASSPSLQVAER